MPAISTSSNTSASMPRRKPRASSSGPKFPLPSAFRIRPSPRAPGRIAHDSGNDFLVGVVDWKRNASGNRRDSGLHPTAPCCSIPPASASLPTIKFTWCPFGEYVPLRRWLTFAGRLTADISDFTPGVEYRVGQAAGPETSASSSATKRFSPVKFASSPPTARKLLINISNDGWFGRSAAPAQHLMMARVRAVENRRWLLRDTNNGFTVSIDPYGRIAARLPTDIRGELDAPYDFRTDLTPYVASATGSLALLLVSIGILGLSLRTL